MDTLFENITILTKEQGLREKQILMPKAPDSRHGELTDFAILLGAEKERTYTHIGVTNTAKNYGLVFTRTSINGDVYGLHTNGDLDITSPVDKNVSIRPAFLLSEELTKDEIITYIFKLDKAAEFTSVYLDRIEFQFGEYPQMTVDKVTEATLNREYREGNYTRTGKSYSTVKGPFKRGFMPSVSLEEEIEINGVKYIRFKVDKRLQPEILLSNCEKVTSSYVWIKVSPIKWVCDIEGRFILSNRALLSGIGINYNHDEYDGDFERTDLQAFLQQAFLEDINMEFVTTKNNEAQIKLKATRRTNPYNFNFDKVSEEDIIRGAVESGIPVFLHGQSSDGKSARVKQLDPDAVIIYLRNASPDSLNGKSIVGTDGNLIDIPPTWYQKLTAICEAEPNKIHILLFDEITNATPNIQGMAYNIVLDKEVNGVWKLPANARIVAAGNDYDDSLAANQLAEPLFNRFSHVYIKTNVEDWLKWAVTADIEPKKLDYQEEKTNLKIHPSIFAFISSRREQALRTDYTGDKPNADPRKWEMASKILYKTEQPEMLRALIGESLTRDFIAFCKQSLITLQDIIDDNYSDADLEMRMDEKWATIVGLSVVDSKNLLKVRNFVSKLGQEILAAFDLLWIKGDKNKMEIISEMRYILENESKVR